MNLTTRVLIALGAGLATGAAVAAAPLPGLVRPVSWIEPAGTLWINALRMTVVPLVVAGIIGGAASARDARTIGRLGGRGLLYFIMLLAAAATFTVVVAPVLLAGLNIDPAATASLRGDAGATVAAADRGFPDLRKWLVDLVPGNIMRAAADAAMLQLIVFSVLFGLAVSRIGTTERAAIILFFRAIFDAMLMLVRWVLELAPIGVFALALQLASRMGLSAAGAVLYYVVLVVALCMAVLAVLYPFAALLGRISVTRFARGVLPAQTIAFSARSSLAALPAMIEHGEIQLGFSERITGFFLPLSASMFRLGSAVAIPTGVLFICRLYGVALDPPALATIAITSVLLTFSVPGVPGGSILIMMPVLLAVGAPPEGVGILLGVDTIPDMFRTMTNTSGTLAVATVLAHSDSEIPAVHLQPAEITG